MAERDPAWKALEKPPHPHDSACLHVAGEARYADDLAEPDDMLHLAFGQSREAHGRIVAIDLSEARAAEGVVAVYTAADIPGANDVSPVAGDDRLLADAGLTRIAVMGRWRYFRERELDPMLGRRRPF